MLICVDDKTKSYQPTTLGAEYICPSMRLDIGRVLFCVVMDPDKVKVQKKTKACIHFFLHLNPQFIYFFLHPNHNSSNRSHEGLTLETSAFKLFTVANLRYQLS